MTTKRRIIIEIETEGMDLVALQDELRSHLNSVQQVRSFEFQESELLSTAPTCPECGDTLTDRTTTDNLPSYCDSCDREVTS